MSQHENCSPMCLPYQGTVMIDDVFTALSHDDAVQMARETGYTRLATAIENHAFHPNCRHSLSTWYPGKSSIPEPFTKEQNEAAVNRYNLEQEQRKLENNLRKWRRIEAGSVDKENKDVATQMVEKSRQELRNHVEENPNLRRNYWRERLPEPMGISYDQFPQDTKQYNKYLEVLGPDRMPDSVVKFQDVKYNDSVSWESLKDDYHNTRFGKKLQNSLNYSLDDFIPKNAVFTKVKTIAAVNSKTPIHDLDRLTSTYGEGDWEKRLV